MNTQKVIEELKRKYPSKNIVKNFTENAAEILCEIESGNERSVAIAVVDKIPKHYHKQTRETYKIITGELELHLDDKKMILREGDEVTIKPGEVHWGFGEETWFEVHSEPGWILKDHIVIED